MASKKQEVLESLESNEKKQETRFTKEQILASKKYVYRKDICKVLLPEDFYGTLEEVDTFMKNFMKGKVN